jgi:hypothetical protein
LFCIIFSIHTISTTDMRNEIPLKIDGRLAKIPESDKIWIKEIIKNYFQRKKTDSISLLITLHDKLEKNFDPAKIDYRLLANDNIPTLPALLIVNPNNPIIELSNMVLWSIKKYLLDNQDIRRFEASDIAGKIGYTGDDMDLCFQLLFSLGKFFQSASTLGSKNFGYDFVEINSLENVRNILRFEDIRLTINELLETQKKDYLKSVESKQTANSDLQIVKPNTGFIIMRMDPDYKEGEDICNAIKEVCKMFKIEASRSDDYEHSDSITEVILKKIHESEFLIADLSGERPNVYYEVGYAHAINKRPILYRKQGSKLHFDLSVHNVPEYSNITDLKKMLISRFESITGRELKKS